MKCFLTGSRIYGTPTEDSDLDMVVLADDDMFDRLRAMYAHENDVDRQYEKDSLSIRVGSLNMIVVKTELSFLAWKHAKDALVQEVELTGRPVTRDRAVEAHKSYRRVCGLDG